ncbi:ribose transport system permease protein [Ruminiclostridium sufflavum DSM 19573]|uniref:Autoinducer 2 import system permease protein LsrD n=1 Tax=Ruminiclostridium sufflavum DSM 19573 TaxID=1121337 RepID=A0A318XTX8_9FIRM|nr:ABC transporter permease [Ruminiclostridium sufflavum]PYG89939.1 ribose transport system permease protein [Ruminiclostridium sufflavum DSM 19573]
MNNTVNKLKKIDLKSITLYIGAIVILLAFTIICKANGKDFLTSSNIQNIISQSSVMAVVAIGASLVILTGGIDLSVGSIVGFVGIFGGIMIKSGVPLFAVIVICCVVCALIGLATGYFVSFGKVPAFIVTLGTMQIIRGLTKVLTSGKPVSGFPEALSKLSSFEIFGIPIIIIYVFIFYVLIVFTLSKTKFGRRIYSIGGNPNAAKLSGVKVNKIEMLTYMLAGLFSAFGGLMLLSRLSYADPNAGSGYEMDAIAAVVIGGIALSGGKGKVANTLVGALILGMLKCGLQILNVPTYYQTIIIGVVIIAAVYMDKAKERKAE